MTAPARPDQRRTATARGSVVLAALAVVALLALAACSTAPSGTEGPISTASIVDPATGAPGSGDLVSPLSGVLVRIEAAGLSEVKGFTLRTNDGREIVFKLGPLENGTEFPPGHLAEHLATSSPVKVFFRPDGTDLVVYRLEDANP